MPVTFRARVVLGAIVIAIAIGSSSPSIQGSDVSDSLRLNSFEKAPTIPADAVGRAAAAGSPDPAGALADRLRAGVAAWKAGVAASTAEPLEGREASVPGLTVRTRARSHSRALLELRTEARQASLGRPVRSPTGVTGLGLTDVQGSADGLRDATTARSFLRRHRGLLRISEPDEELVLTRQVEDELGRRHLRFTQVFRGVPVWPAEVNVHLDPLGDVDLVNGAYVATPYLVDLDPRIDARSAARAARAVVGAGEGVAERPPSLVIHATGTRPPRLAWLVEVPVSAAVVWVVALDARTGESLGAFNRIPTDAAAGSGLDLNGVERPLDLWLEDGTYYLIDTSKPMYDATSTPPTLDTTRGAIIILDARNKPQTSDPKFIPELFHVTSDQPDSGFLADGVSAAHGISETHDYYLERHGLSSYDGEGTRIIGLVRLGQDYPNAFWDGSKLVFGDAQPYAGSLDVVAHEFTHGVTEKSANLVYVNQSGALNEAFSDVFGEAVEARSTGSADWIIGSDLGEVLRDIQDPSSVLCCFGRSYPSKFSEFIITSEDNGGVHINSTIVGHCFYLLAEGLPGAIGLEDAEKVFYRALSVHLTRNSQFVDARLACIRSAEELFGEGSPQALKTAEAFDAVEILDGAPKPDPEPFPEVPGPDATLFVYTDPDVDQLFLGRREEALDDPAGGVVLSPTPLAPARPSVSGDGSFAAFVKVDQDLCLIDTSGAVEQCLDLPGVVHSVAVAPSGDVFGFVLLDEGGNPTDSITVIDLQADSTLTFPLLAPAGDGGELGTVLYADTMDFTANGRYLVYDAFTEISTDDGTTLGVWSIYAIDLATETTLTLVAPVQGVDIGFPSLAQTSDDRIVFEARDQTTGESTILIGDLQTGDVFDLLTVTGGFGIPGFNGDDEAVLYADADEAVPSGYTLKRQALGADGVSPEGDPQVWLPDARIGVIYRRGEFQVPEHDLAVLSVKAPRSVALSEAKPSRTVTVKVTLQNQGPSLETIQDLDVLRNLVRLTVEPLGDCPSPLAAVVPPKKPFPLLLKPGKKLAVSFTVEIECFVDPAKNTATSPGHEDYRYAVTVDTSALQGRPDTDPGDDRCPREGAGSAAGFQGKLDPGCGSKLPTGAPGGPVTTDVVVK